jgi:hypothetical protein
MNDLNLMVKREWMNQRKLLLLRRLKVLKDVFGGLEVEEGVVDLQLIQLLETCCLVACRIRSIELGFQLQNNS